MDAFMDGHDASELIPAKKHNRAKEVYYEMVPCYRGIKFITDPPGLPALAIPPCDWPTCLYLQAETADQKAQFDTQLANAKLTALNQKADFDSQMAKATLDNADQRALFDSQMAKAVLDATNMKVGQRAASRHVNCVAMRRQQQHIHRCMAAPPCACVPI